MDVKTVQQSLKRCCDEMGQREFCRQHELDPSGVCNMIAGRKKISEKVARAAGYKLIYVRIDDRRMI